MKRPVVHAPPHAGLRESSRPGLHRTRRAPEMRMYCSRHGHDGDVSPTGHIWGSTVSSSTASARTCPFSPQSLLVPGRGGRHEPRRKAAPSATARPHGRPAVRDSLCDAADVVCCSGNSVENDRAGPAASATCDRHPVFASRRCADPGANCTVTMCGPDRYVRGSVRTNASDTDEATVLVERWFPMCPNTRRHTLHEGAAAERT